MSGLSSRIVAIALIEPGRTMIVRHVYLAWLRQRLRRFLADARRAREIQHRALLRKIARNADSDFGRDYGFCKHSHRRRFSPASAGSHVRGPSSVHAAGADGDVTRIVRARHASADVRHDLGHDRRAEAAADHRGVVPRISHGLAAVGRRRVRRPSRPVRKKTLQLTSDWQQYRAPCGVPCGQISGLAATTRPRIARRMFLPPPSLSRIHDPAAKHYATLRFALAIAATWA